MTRSNFSMNPGTNCAGATPAFAAAPLRKGLAAATVIAAVWLATPAAADPFFFSTGAADGLVGALSVPAGNAHLQTETADDFNLTETTTIAQATIAGLVPPGTPLANIGNVEVELYHVFPRDSVERAVVQVPSRVNSPADVEIGSATRDASLGTLAFHVDRLRADVTVLNSVSDGVHAAPGNQTHGDGAVHGDVVEITITFTPPIVLPADHYFFRPEVEVNGGQFLFLSSAKPIVAPGTPFLGDLQAWIRNSALQPDWLRIGTDIVADTPLRTFNMTVSMAGDTVPQAGIPGTANCRGKSTAAMAEQFGSLEAAAQNLGFSSVASLQRTFRGFCGPGRSRS